MPEDALRILILEDVPMDAELVEYELERARIPFTARRVDSREEFLRELEANNDRDWFKANRTRYDTSGAGPRRRLSGRGAGEGSPPPRGSLRAGTSSRSPTRAGRCSSRATRR